MPLQPDSVRVDLDPRFTPTSLFGEQQGRSELAALFRIHRKSLVKLMARRLRCSEAVAEDACAHAWLQLWRKRPEDHSRIVGLALRRRAPRGLPAAGNPASRAVRGRPCR